MIDVNEKIMKIWKDNPTESGKYSPLLYPKFKEGGILFIGLNPSKSKSAFNFISKDENALTFEEFFKKGNMDKCKDALIKYEKLAKEKYSYFKKFREIKEDFQHIDLFLYRLTNQEEFKEIIGLSKKKVNGKETIVEENNFRKFGKKQLELTSDLIQQIKPKIIVVANAFASYIIKHYSDIFKLNKDENYFSKKGYYKIKIGSNEIPIIFTSMLTGQRALDNHTFKLLKWHIHKILDNSI